MAEQNQQFVWDVPTRVFHWLLVALLCFSWWSAESDHMEWHQYSGITICGLVAFRIMWGFVGTSTARFTQFVKGPRAVWAHINSKDASSQNIPGHNPLGGWSVIALLLMVCTQFVSGLFAVDIDGIESGPLSYLIDFDQGRSVARVHAVGFNVLMVLITVHVVAILFYYLVKRRNLTKAMITGFQPVYDIDSTATILVSRWRLVAVVAVAALFAYFVASGFRF